VATACTEGITHEESLRVPAASGNGMNWIVGHLTHVNDEILRLLGGEGVTSGASLARYAPGAPPVAAGDAHPFEELRRILVEQTPRLDAAWDAVAADRLRGPAPPGFGETLEEFLRFLVFHQAYHTGQCGIVRRQLGKDRAF